MKCILILNLSEREVKASYLSALTESVAINKSLRIYVGSFSNDVSYSAYVQRFF